MNPLCYYYNKYQCFALSCLAYGGNWCGCCGNNTSRCADIYWTACCPFRSAVGIPFGLLGALCDLGYLLCHCGHCGHCCGEQCNSNCLQCTQEWCGCQCLPSYIGNATPFSVSADYGLSKSISTFSEMAYFVCCAHGHPSGFEVVKHCVRCEPTIMDAAVVPPVPPVVPRPSISIASVTPSSIVIAPMSMSRD